MALSEKELSKLKKATLERMYQDRQKLLMRFPFTGGFLMRLEFVPVRDLRLRTAATDGVHVFMDIAFCAELSADERIFILAHETWHCIFMHMLRCQTRDQRLFNVATDMEVNRMLAKEGLKTPDGSLMPKREWSDLSAEEIYERLRGQSNPPPEILAGKDGRKRDAESFDKHIYGGAVVRGGANPSVADTADGAVVDRWGEVGIDKDFVPAIDKNLAEKTRERIVAVAQQTFRGRGHLPGHLGSVVQAALKPQIRWQEVLSQFVTVCYGGSRRWLPPSRRHLGRGLYLQSSRTERLRAVLVVDTSSSTTGDLPQFFAELTSLLRSFGDYVLTVIQCDCAIHHVETFDFYHPFHAPEWVAFGHGGTDFRPPFDYIAEHPEIAPSCLVYITDGQGSASETSPPYPVLWVLTSDGRKPAFWGTELRLMSKDA